MLLYGSCIPSPKHKTHLNFAKYRVFILRYQAGWQVLIEAFTFKAVEGILFNL